MKKEKLLGMNKKVAVHLADGFEEIEAITIIDVLRRAGVDVVTVSITGKLDVYGAHQIKVSADVIFEQVNYDEIFMIVLPGGMPGSSNLNEHKDLRAQIVLFNDANKQLAAICAAPLVYGNLGILNGRRAVCYPGFEKYLKGADILNIPVTESGNITTGRGPGVAIKFALKLVEKLVSVQKAEQVADQMLVE